MVGTTVVADQHADDSHKVSNITCSINEESHLRLVPPNKSCGLMVDSTLRFLYNHNPCIIFFQEQRDFLKNLIQSIVYIEGVTGYNKGPEKDSLCT